MEFAPAGYPTFFTAQKITINDIRAIRIGTLPPTPTSLILPGHDPSESALMCWASNGDKSFAQYWVTADGGSQLLCRSTTYETLRPEQVGSIGCE